MSKRLSISNSVSDLLLRGLKNLQAHSEHYLYTYKSIDFLQDSVVDWGKFCDGEENWKDFDEYTKKKIIKKNVHKIKKIEFLSKDWMNNDQMHANQKEILLTSALETYIAVQCKINNKFFVLRCYNCYKNILTLLEVDDYLPTIFIRHVIKIIHSRNFWKQTDECSNLIIELFDKCKDRGIFLLYIVECMQPNYEYLGESALILHSLLTILKPIVINENLKILVERCCQLLASCDPTKKIAKSALNNCLYAMSIDNMDTLCPILALHSIRVSFGIYRSDIADVLYKLCRDNGICDAVELIGPLIFLANDRDPDVAIRGYQILTQVVSPMIACIYQNAVEFFPLTNKIESENQMEASPEIFIALKSEIKNIILSMLLSYIRHSAYPKTLEALLIFNCTIIIEIRDPALLSRITSFLINLQEAALSILPLKSLRQSFMQWAVTHLFLLVSDIYSISSLKEYVFSVIEQRKIFTPFLVSPIAPTTVDLIPSSCLMEKQLVNTIIENWNELIQPTRSLHESSQASSLSDLSVWNEFTWDF